MYTESSQVHVASSTSRSFESERRGLTKETSPYIIFGWRARFSADLPILQMYGPGITGVFALVCELIDRQEQVVGQGRGVAELRGRSSQITVPATRIASPMATSERRFIVARQ